MAANYGLNRIRLRFFFSIALHLSCCRNKLLTSFSPAHHKTSSFFFARKRNNRLNWTSLAEFHKRINVIIRFIHGRLMNFLLFNSVRHKCNRALCQFDGDECRMPPNVRLFRWDLHQDQDQFYFSPSESRSHSFQASRHFNRTIRLFLLLRNWIFHLVVNEFTCHPHYFHWI